MMGITMNQMIILKIDDSQWPEINNGNDNDNEEVYEEDEHEYDDDGNNDDGDDIPFGEKEMQELYNLDYEDIVAGMPCRFKYRQVDPDSFGLTADEILEAEDIELNKYVGIRKLSTYRQDSYSTEQTRSKSEIKRLERKKKALLAAIQEQKMANQKPKSNSEKSKQKEEKIVKVDSTVDAEENTIDTQEDAKKKRKRHKKKKSAPETTEVVSTVESSSKNVSKKNKSKENNNGANVDGIDAKKKRRMDLYK